MQIGYMRISKGEQTTTLQEDALAKAVVVLLSSTHYVDPTVFSNFALFLERVEGKQMLNEEVWKHAKSG